MSAIPICSICCDKFSSNSVVQSTKCGHLFHGDCIRRWLSSNSTCPECRQVSRLLHRIYLNFDTEAAEETDSRSSFNIATPQEIENLILKLSIEEAKRQSAENCVQENARKIREHTDMAKRKDKDYQMLMKSFNEVKISLEEEKRRRSIAEDSAETLQKELNARRLTSSKKTPAQTISSTNKVRKETAKLTIKLQTSPCVQVFPHHHNASRSRTASGFSARSCHGMQSSHIHSDSEEFLLQYF